MFINAIIYLQLRKTKKSYRKFTNIGSLVNFKRFFQIEKLRKLKKVIELSKIMKQIFAHYLKSMVKRV